MRDRYSLFYIKVCATHHDVDYAILVDPNLLFFFCYKKKEEKVKHLEHLEFHNDVDLYIHITLDLYKTPIDI